MAGSTISPVEAEPSDPGSSTWGIGLWLLIDTLFYGTIIWIGLSYTRSGEYWSALSSEAFRDLSPATFGIPSIFFYGNFLLLTMISCTQVLVTINIRKRRKGISALLLILGFLLGAASILATAWNLHLLNTKRLLPQSAGEMMYDQADETYLFGLKQAIRRQLRREDLLSKHSSESTKKLLERMQTGLIEWTEAKIAGDPFGDPRVLIELAAVQLAPDSFSKQKVLELEGLEHRLRNETLQKSESVRQRSKEARQELEKVQLRLRNRNVTPEQRDSWIGEAGSLTRELTELSLTESRIQARLWYCDKITETPGGLKSAYNLELPIVVPCGKSWVRSYVAWTILHAMHVLAGLIWIGTFLREQILCGSGWSAPGLPRCWKRARNSVAYWLFQTVVWLVLVIILRGP